MFKFRQISVPSSSPISADFFSLLLLIIASFVFAIRIMIAKLALDKGIEPFQLGVVNNLAAGLVLLPFVLASGQTIALSPKHLCLYLSLGMVSFAVPTILSYVIVQEIGPAYTSSLYSLSPILTIGFAAGLRVEPFTLRRTLGISCGLLGMLLLIYPNLGGVDTTRQFWILIGLFIPISTAFGNVIRTLYWPKESPVLSFSCATLVFSSIAALMAAPFFENPADWDFTRWDGMWWLFILVLISALSQLLNLKLQDLAGPVIFSQIGYWGTGFGIILGAILFGDRLDILSLIGLGTIIGGGLLANHRVVQKYSCNIFAQNNAGRDER